MTSSNIPGGAESSRWVFDANRLALVLDSAGAPAYSIELRQIISSACMLDIIFGVKRQDWASNDIVGDLITAFQELFDPQVTLCGGGKDRTLDPAAHLKARIQ